MVRRFPVTWRHPFPPPPLPVKLASSNRRLVHNRAGPIVAKPLMASRQALPAGLRFREPYRQMPYAERHVVPNMFWVIRGMGVVARPARAPFGFIYMDKMQVLIAVSESSHGLGPFLAGDEFFVTHETDLVIILIVARIEEVREKLAQHSEVLGTVCIVTA